MKEPERLAELMLANPRYIFFGELETGEPLFEGVPPVPGVAGGGFDASDRFLRCGAGGWGRRCSGWCTMGELRSWTAPSTATTVSVRRRCTRPVGPRCRSVSIGSGFLTRCSPRTDQGPRIPTCLMNVADFPWLSRKRLVASIPSIGFTSDPASPETEGNHVMSMHARRPLALHSLLPIIPATLLAVSATMHAETIVAWDFNDHDRRRSHRRGSGDGRSTSPAWSAPTPLRRHRSQRARRGGSGFLLRSPRLRRERSHLRTGHSR